MTKMTKSEKAHQDRCRFNSGFHDATLDGELGNNRRVVGYGQRPLPRGAEWTNYRIGYVYGWEAYRDTKTRPESSDAAWDAYQVSLNACGPAFRQTRV